MHMTLIRGAVLLGALALTACGSDNNGDARATGGAPSLAGVGGGGAQPTAGQGGAVGGGGATGLSGVGGSAGLGGSAGNASAGAGASAGGAAAGAAGAGGALAGSGGIAGAGGAASGASGQAGSAGQGQAMAPGKLSETGLFSQRNADGSLVLAEGVREFQPKYWLWSDGSDKKRYIYLPPGSKIDTTDADHWVFPSGTKLWKSFISNNQLVETRLIERTGDGPNDWRYATYFWMTADATDAVRMEYKNLLLNAAGTTHDIPNGMMCERCHNTSKERVLGFSALQLNHELPGVTLKTLVEGGSLTTPIPLTVKMPGNDQKTQDALGYLHANCGNCHNDSPGLPLESVPAPQLMLRVSVNDKTLEDTGIFKTAINKESTASSELSVPFRIKGGSEADSAVYFRMTQRMIEDQMPPIGTEKMDETGLELIRSWIKSLPPQ